jgi:hypothetical protein
MAQKITAEEFYAMITENPSVFKHWNTPLEITEFVKCDRSPITHLSKHLSFSGKNEDGRVAEFTHCPDLKIATGTFKGGVRFSYSGIEKIENLRITKASKYGNSVSFSNCKSLKIATGTYPGKVTFLHSGIHSIQNLHVETPNTNGNYGNFQKCPNLQTLEGWDLSKPIWIEPEKLASEKKRRAALQKFWKENQIEELPFL